MRQERRVEVPPDPRPVATWVTDYTCDGCGKKITREWTEENDHNFAHELHIQLDGEECVNFFRRRDYCPQCLDPIWTAINTLIKADPDTERDREYE